MKVSVKDAGGCRRVMHVEVPPEAVADDYSRVVAEFTKAARLPGFRRGRAPVAIVARTYAKEILDEARDRLVPRYYLRAIEQESLKAVAIVQVQDVSLDPARGMDFKVTVDVEPDIKLPKYRKLSLDSQSVAVGEPDVDQAIEALRARRARFEDVTDRPAAEGDLVRVDYSGTCEGKAGKDWGADCAGLGEGHDFWALVGEPEFLPGMAKGLAGLRIGESRTIDVTFPDEFRVASVRGKTASYRVDLKGIRKRILPEMDEAFLKTVSCSGVEELRSKVRADLERLAAQREEDRIRDEVVKYLLEEVKCDLPEALVARQTHATARSLVRRFALQGASREQIQERSNEIVGAAHRSSSDRIKLSYILQRIAEEEKVQVSDDEVEERVKRLAQARGEPVEKVRSEIEEHSGLDGLRDDIKEEKVLDLLMGIARQKGGAA